MNILIAGDSFAADWSTKYDVQGWPNFIASQHTVTNVAQAGCGEYKILQQLKSQDLSKYDKIVVSHTSPYRIHVAKHPVHKNDILHYASDFIYADVVEHKLTDVQQYFEQYFDMTYAKDIHTLVCKEIDAITAPYNTLHITHSNWKGLYPFAGLLDFAKVNAKHPGFANHYSNKGNALVYKKLLASI